MHNRQKRDRNCIVMGCWAISMTGSNKRRSKLQMDANRQGPANDLVTTPGYCKSTATKGAMSEPQYRRQNYKAGMYDARRTYDHRAFPSKHLQKVQVVFQSRSDHGWIATESFLPLWNADTGLDPVERMQRASIGKCQSLWMFPTLTPNMMMSFNFMVRLSRRSEQSIESINC